ncbi:MAG TPA: putative metal-binding motif-containing protein, partial [Myxococcales bacterium]|nr:putative metal-binding motif-containing protein [Myxococcales bacterium]
MPLLPPRLSCHAVAALALLVASGCWVDPALRIHVAVPSSLRASCVKVSVYPSSDVSGTAAGEALVARADGTDDLYVGIYKRTLPGQVWITAQAMFGAECANPLLPNGPAAQISASFPSSGVTPVDLAIPAPTAAEDGDGDGFLGLPNGRDCNDGNRDVNPGAAERCQEPDDYNCDGRVGCADPTCPATACIATPTQLGFVTAPKTQVA